MLLHGPETALTPGHPETPYFQVQACSESFPPGGICPGHHAFPSGLSSFTVQVSVTEEEGTLRDSQT